MTANLTLISSGFFACFRRYLTTFCIFPIAIKIVSSPQLNVKHSYFLILQLRWYDSMEDSATKGFIDLSEVELVKPFGGRPVQGAPKKADENGFFEVRIIL